MSNITDIDRVRWHVVSAEHRILQCISSPNFSTQISRADELVKACADYYRSVYEVFDLECEQRIKDIQNDI